MLPPEFSITVLFKKSQYQDFLKTQNLRLHWWFELLALLYLLFLIIYSFFAFVGLSGQDVPNRGLWRSWLVLVLLSFFTLVLVSEFSALGVFSFFRKSTTSSMWRFQISSPGELLITSFLLLNTVGSLAILLWKIKPFRFPKNNGYRNGFLLIASLISALFIQQYFLVCEVHFDSWVSSDGSTDL